MSNSSPISTIFVDFRTAFDQLWFDGCIGKLRCLGIPPAYLNWIYVWLLDRRSFIEINETRSRWFNIDKGCPQEKRIKIFIDHLEYYSYLTDQPINTYKTQALSTARAIGHPKFDIHFNSGSKEKINWVPEYKYL
ncbi:unnamed protein product, partial [Rotaria magnacalcarata]